MTGPRRQRQYRVLIRSKSMGSAQVGDIVSLPSDLAKTLLALGYIEEVTDNAIRSR